MDSLTRKGLTKFAKFGIKMDIELEVIMYYNYVTVFSAGPGPSLDLWILVSFQRLYISSVLKPV